MLKLLLQVLRPHNLMWGLNHIRSGSTKVIHNLQRRGVIKELFPAESKPIISSGTLCAYAGFDATSDSLHVGNLMIVIALLHWQRAGHQAIVVVGDSTAEVGDPSGRKTQRDALEADKVENNATSIEQSIYRIFQNHHSFLWDKKKTELIPIKILRNSSWYDQMNATELISKVGRHLRVGDMLSRTSVKLRMMNEEGISLSEFCYQLYQAYDWLHLFNRYNCQFQIGGGDQLGNIVTGYELISGLHTKDVYGMLLPLIQSESGDKYGKTAGNAVHLNEDKTGAFNLYQFFLRVPDGEVEKYLRCFTFLSEEEIQDAVINHMKNPGSHYGQKKIAENVVLLVHGETGLQKAERATKALYESHLESLLQMDVEELRQAIPPSSISELIFEPGMSLLDLALKAKCFLNERDANRIISEGGFYMNFEKVKSPSLQITPSVHILSNSSTILRVGKKTYYLIIWK